MVIFCDARRRVIPAMAVLLGTVAICPGCSSSVSGTTLASGAGSRTAASISTPVVGTSAPNRNSPFCKDIGELPGTVDNVIFDQSLAKGELSLFDTIWNDAPAQIKPDAHKLYIDVRDRAGGTDIPDLPYSFQPPLLNLEDFARHYCNE